VCRHLTSERHETDFRALFMSSDRSVLCCVINIWNSLPVKRWPSPFCADQPDRIFLFVFSKVQTFNKSHNSQISFL